MPRANHVPSLTTEQMREVDRLMIEEYGITLLQMMENAGRNLARLAARLAGGASGKGFVVLAGGGNNGGGGLASARHLSNMGADVSVVPTAAVETLAGAPAQQAVALSAMGGELLDAGAAALADVLSEADLLIDAVIGYGLSGPPRGAVAGVLEAANASGRPILSLDVPSGVDAGSGAVHERSVRAVATLTLALPKTGLSQPEVRGRLGELYLADISVPPGLYRRLGLEVGPLFEESSLVRLRWSDRGWVPEPEGSL